MSELQNEQQSQIQKQSHQLEQESNSFFNEELNRRFQDLEEHYTNALGYTRIDESVFAQFTQAQLEKNAIHGPLTGYNLIAKYHVYQSEEHKSEVVCLLQIGDRLCGHPEIVHGGIISAIFDNNFGWLFIAMKEKPAFTANLNINFRKPTYANSIGIIRTKLDRIEGRKIFMTATWENISGDVQADATTLFIRPRPAVVSEDEATKGK